MAQTRAPKQKRAAIYVRLSSMREDDPTLSPQSQESSARAYAESQGWEVVAVERDLDLSGSEKGLRLERPGLSALLKRLGEFDVIIARELSRFARSVIDFTLLASQCRERGVALVSVKESLDLSTSSGRFVATILSAFAEMEAAITGERVAAFHAEAAQMGRYSGGQIPYGYKRVRLESGGSTLEPDPKEAKIVARAVKMILEDGKSLYQVADTFNNEGLRTTAGTRFQGHSLRRILTNPTMVGRRVYQGEVVRGKDGMPVQAYPPIMSLSDYERLRSIYPGGEARKYVRRESLLSGIAVCDLCGKNLHRAVGGTATVKYDSMRCGGRSAGRDCRGLQMKEAHISEYVTEKYLEKYGRFKEVRVEEHTRDASGLAETESALRDVTEAMRKPGADIGGLAAMAAELAERRDVLAMQEETVTEQVETGRLIRDAWEDSADDLAYRRELLAQAIDEVRVKPGVRGRRKFDENRVVIRWRGMP